MNRQVLAERQKRVDAKRKQEERTAAAVDQMAADLAPHSAPASAAELLTDEWDRGVFGEALPTITRKVYGPDPLLEGCPEFRDRLEQNGLAEYANATAEAIRSKGSSAVPDPVMRKGLKKAIDRFGVEAVAQAFRDRVMKIPVREYEVEVEREDTVQLADPMRDAVERYGRPGMRAKFLSERCMGALGMRGYEIAKNERGDPVKVGTLIMGEIPERWAQERLARYAGESEAALREMEDGYMDAQDRLLRAAGAAGVPVAGSRPLAPDESMLATATESENYLGQARAGGLRFERENGA
jgi:hypothetical protein